VGWVEIVVTVALVLISSFGSYKVSMATVNVKIGNLESRIEKTVSKDVYEVTIKSMADNIHDTKENVKEIVRLLRGINDG